MLSKLCCGLGNLLGLIGRERSINRESEPLHANADLEGHESLETLTEAVQCTDDQEGSKRGEQTGHSWYGARKCLGGVPRSVKNPYKPLMANSEEKCHNGVIKERENGKLKLCGGVKLALKFDVEARLSSDTEEE